MRDWEESRRRLGWGLRLVIFNEQEIGSKANNRGGISSVVPICWKGREMDVMDHVF